jgi:hypothetical protein
VEDTGASLQARIQPTAFAALTSGTASEALPLSIGSNTLDVRVTSQDGSIIKTYSIVITRQTAFTTALASFSSSHSLPADSASNADPDGDGKTNLEEFAFGTNPNSNSSGTNSLAYTGTFAAATLSVTGQPTMRFERSSTTGVDNRAVFTRRADHASLGLTYTIQFSANMTTWSTSTTIPTVLNTQGDYQLVSVRYPLFVGGRPARFFRITINQP